MLVGGEGKIQVQPREEKARVTAGTLHQHTASLTIGNASPVRRAALSNEILNDLAHSC